MTARSALKTPYLELKAASLAFNGRTLWDRLDLAVHPGEFIAILGPNGSGKTSLLQVLLGLQPLSSGSVYIQGLPVARGNKAIGYIPQQKAFDSGLPLRGRDLVRLGLDGHVFGPFSKTKVSRVDKAISQVDATDFANKPLSLLSGGEQQRLRVAQALVSSPHLLLCDEPLLSLDIASQLNITRLIDGFRRKSQASVMFVTHEINPILPYVDRILYFANGQWVVGAPDEVLRTKTLSSLYGTPVDVIKVHGHVHVIADESTVTEIGKHHHAEEVH